MPHTSTEIIAAAQETLQHYEPLIEDALAVLPNGPPHTTASENFRYWADSLLPQNSLGTTKTNALRRIAAELDMSAELDICPDTSSRAHFVVEGGSPEKIWTEAGLVAEKPTSLLGTIIFAARKARRLDRDEVESRDHFELDGTNEFDVAESIARQISGFEDPGHFQGEVGEDQEHDLPYVRVLEASYDLVEGFPIGDRRSAQFRRIGALRRNDAGIVDYVPVMTMELRSGAKSGVELNPGPGDVMSIVSRLTDRQSLDTEVPADAAVIYVTDSLHFAASSLWAAKARLQTGLPLAAVAAYGLNHQTRVRGDRNMTPPSMRDILWAFVDTAEAAEGLRAQLEAA